MLRFTDSQRKLRHRLVCCRSCVFFRARLRRVGEQHAHASQTSHFLDTIKHVPFRLVTCELYTLSFVQLASAQMSQSKLCLGSLALCFCGEQLMLHMSMRQHELVLGIVRLETILSPLYGLMAHLGLHLSPNPKGNIACVRCRTGLRRMVRLR